ncbi:hypothetical protein KC19_1G232100 [Ceratodon purpureus]|uniref:Uncharacterized protein n=1 Tax=Ceratodon purpureus TaxID=3225 RepID=A0A8T0JA96_CERPU|nr:hypothetical protein KC19_1G232100 [Ceratodon purpureus]
MVAFDVLSALRCSRSPVSLSRLSLSLGDRCRRGIVCPGPRLNFSTLYSSPFGLLTLGVSVRVCALTCSSPPGGQCRCGCVRWDIVGFAGWWWICGGFVGGGGFVGDVGMLVGLRRGDGFCGDRGVLVDVWGGGGVEGCLWG